MLAWVIGERVRLTLSLVQPGQVVGIFMRKATQKAIELESVEHPTFLLLGGRRLEELSVGIEQTGKASNKCSTDLVRIEGGWTNNVELGSATSMN